MRSIVLANQKGGVGKTTTAIHLAHGLALAGSRVVLMDFDPQGNATVALQGMAGGEQGVGALEWMTPVAGQLWLVPSAGHEEAPSERHIDTDRLAALMGELEGSIDVVIVDCPPRMDAWGWAGVQLCEEVIIPVQAEFFAMHGLSQMMASLEAAARMHPGKGRLRGVLPTMVDLDEPVAGEILEDLRRNLGGLMLESIIFRDASLVEAASHGQSVFVYSPWSKSALCYAELVREVRNG